MKQLTIVRWQNNCLYALYFQSRQFTTEAIEGVKAEEVVDNSAGCLFLLSKDPANHDILRSDPQLLQLLGNLLTSPTDSRQRIAAGILHEFSFNPDVAMMLSQNIVIMDNIRLLVGAKNEKTGNKE